MFHRVKQVNLRKCGFASELIGSWRHREYHTTMTCNKILKKKNPDDYLKTESPYFTHDRIKEGEYAVVNQFKSVDTTKIQVPPYYESMKGEYSTSLELFTNDDDLTRIRKVNKLAAEVLRYAGTLVKEGVTTEEIDAKIFEKIVS